MYRHTHTHMHTQRCYELGMPKNTGMCTELKQVRIKWPQLVGDRDRPRKHTQWHTKSSH
jgi:hypothetical protein